MPNFEKLQRALSSVTAREQRDIPKKSFGQRDDSPHPESATQRTPSQAERMAGTTPLKG